MSSIGLFKADTRSLDDSSYGLGFQGLGVGLRKSPNPEYDTFSRYHGIPH